jgi:hypothetical protein
MNIAGQKRALQLTGLTAHQLREWTVRRKLVRPDRAPNGPGSRMGFSWRAVLQLRLLATMHNRFGAGLEDSRPVMDALGGLLEQHSFPALWGRLLIVRDDHTVFLGAPPPGCSCLVLVLDPHLEQISSGFTTLPHPPRQLTLFPALPARLA